MTTPLTAPAPTTTVLDVSVWALALPAVLDPADLAVLDQGERARAARYLRAQDAVSFAAGRAATRQVLAGLLGVTPELLGLGHHRCPGCGSPDHGPPRITAPSTTLSFSFSGSARHALLAVAPGGPVGVDLEPVRPVDLAALTARHLSSAEAAFLRSVPEEHRHAAFHRIWVRKEAVTKAGGVGIVTDLRAVHVSPGSRGPVTVRHAVGDGPSAWTVADLALWPGVAAAVARPAGECARP